MSDKQVHRLAGLLIVVLLLLAFGGFVAAKNKYERIEAIAQGEEAQLGQRINITIIIYELSTDDEQKVIVDAFSKAGQEGLFNTLNKMKSHGRIAISGTLGYDICYIRQIQTPEGRKLRMVTDRPVRFGEVWSDSRSKDFNLSAFEILLSPVKGKSSGVLLPEMQIKVKPGTNEVELEAFKNPWKIIDIIDYPVR